MFAKMMAVKPSNTHRNSCGATNKNIQQETKQAENGEGEIGGNLVTCKGFGSTIVLSFSIRRDKLPYVHFDVDVHYVFEPGGHASGRLL